VERNNQKKAEAQQYNQLNFTFSEIEELGIVALDKFNNMYGLNVANYTVSNLKRLYRDIIENPQKFKPFAEWLYPRFGKFISWEMSMKIYIGGKEQFIHRGDEKLEKSLNIIHKAIDEYIFSGKTTPKRISALFYYLNFMFK
jgi:predicted 3-demethylubiquinone-9 3-methyltransferase (glyoxalase superfamily)